MMKGLIATTVDRRSAMFRRSRVLRNGFAVVSASALAGSLIAAVPASAASPSADIAVTDSASAFLVYQKQLVTYTATVTNLGTDDAQNVVMNTGGPFAGVTASPGVNVSCTSSSGITAITTCTTPSLKPGDVVKFWVQRQVYFFYHQCGAGDEAWATTTTFDPNPNNNTAYATVRFNSLQCR